MKTHATEYKGQVVFTTRPDMIKFLETDKEIVELLEASRSYRNTYLQVNEIQAQRELGLWGTNHKGFYAELEKLKLLESQQMSILSTGIAKISENGLKLARFREAEKNIIACSVYAKWSFVNGRYWIPYEHYVDTRYW